VQTNTTTNKIAYTLYPNPTSEVLHLAFDLEQPATLSVDIVNLEGKIVQQFAEKKMVSGKFEENLAIENLAVGFLYRSCKNRWCGLQPNVCEKLDIKFMKNRLFTLLFILVSTSFYGQWWEPQISGVSANLNDVYCIDENNVVIVGTAGTILKTTDGGAHWVQKTSGTASNLEKVQFVNATTGYAVGDVGMLLKTTDAGENWSQIATGITTGLSGLSCLNENLIFVSGDNGLIKSSHDGGATFEDRSYGTNYSFKKIQFVNEDIGYASSFSYYGSDQNAFIKTADGGVTWSLFQNQNTFNFYFLNENTGFIKDGNGMHKTSDGGITLTDIPHTYDYETADLFALNENVLWDVANNFTLCNCSWFCINKTDLSIVNPEFQETSNCYADNGGGLPFAAIHFANETHGYAVGWYGIILKNATGIMENLSTGQFDKKEVMSIFPNPASDRITISFLEKQSEPFTIEITDILGNKITSESYENLNNITFNTASFSKGVYFVKLKSKKGDSIKKLLKE